ncbi:FKBP-type peptidyl-prolyl cis-trans isomerase [Spongiibacter nanhainus]|uniref:Peptidyl-prolyl cis-trans isomerase n=1 Tax=Spongiibacter nanhainus TaxID=2794344 RepID=A0A7T4UQ67_9GAMM|nr:FKBP-type peptidyl-prolyl cis-trans isomerase [Spongiibacter nanhainus]QQD17030.1 FKBP-type peptidyl-prolyl cis-trans isomerase [Spongiibacter nanhainus]
MTDCAIGPDTQITLHFALKLDDGSEVDSTFSRAPATFSFGDGSLLPGVEAKLVGMTPGAKATLRLMPEDAFGQRNPNNIQRFARSDFAADLELEEGLMLSFADAAQSELPGVVASFDAEHVEVDFNHPLAGRELDFVVEIIDVKVQGEVAKPGSGG